MTFKELLSFDVTFKNRSNSAYAVLGAAALTLITLILYVIYGNVYKYYDYMVALDLIFATVCFAAYFVFGRAKGLGFLNMLAVAFVAFGLGVFFFNSYPVWADELNGITMYNSRGGLFPVISLIVLFLIPMVTGIVTCFAKEEEV